MLEKYMFVSHTKHTQRKINGSTSFAIDNIYYVNFRIQEQESVPWCAKFQKPKIRSSWEDFSSSLQFHLMLKICGLSISFHGENNECPTFTYKPFHSLCDLNENPYESLSYENHFEILYVSLLIYN